MFAGHSHDRERKPGRRRTASQGEDVTYTPSQAEGDRETAEEALEEREQRDTRPNTGDSGQGDVTYTPSQAEGDRETIERNLEQKTGER